MKIRNGFVSNSSSSSFICNVCGREESGMDIELSDFGMVRCNAGHIFCEDHQTKGKDSLTLENVREDLLSYAESNLAQFKRSLHKLTKKNEEKPFEPESWNEEQLKNLPGYIEEEKDTIKSIQNMSDEDLEAKKDDIDFTYELPCALCPICTFEVLNESDGFVFLKHKNKIEDKDILEDIKNKYETYEAFKKDMKNED